MKLRLLAILLCLPTLAMDEPGCQPAGGEVSGVSFDDVDGSGTQGGGELGIAGRTIFVDEDLDGLLGSGEVSATTTGDGSYSLEDVPEGTWPVGEILPLGFEQTRPAGLSLLPRVENYGELGARSPTFADVDGDGDLDFAVANNNASSATVFLNDGDGTFDRGTDYAVGGSPRRALLVDLNGDDHPDLAVCNFTPNNVSVLINNGDGTFAPQVTYATGNGTFDMKAVDWDFDDDLDLVTVDLGSNTMTRLQNQGDGTFVLLDQSPTGGRPHSILTTDFDENGSLDFVVTNLAETYVTLYAGSPGGGIQPGVNVQVGANGPIEVYALDLDGDDHLDMATANLCFLCEQSEDISLLFGNGDGTFDAPVHYTVYAGSLPDSPHEIDFIDMNDDGEVDMVVPGSASGDVAVFLNQGAGVFGSKSIYNAGSGGLFRADDADLDLDGDPDIVTADWQDDTMTVFLNDGAGNLTKVHQEAVAAEPRFLELVDLNDDGDEDIVVCGQSSRETSIYTNVFGFQPVVVETNSETSGVDFGSRSIVP